jgi:hypothetical protein
MAPVDQVSESIHNFGRYGQTDRHMEQVANI